MRQRAHDLISLRQWQREWGSLPKPPGDDRNLRWARVPRRRAEQPPAAPADVDRGREEQNRDDRPAG
jgi:hypothetical protein